MKPQNRHNCFHMENKHPALKDKPLEFFKRKYVNRKNRSN